MSAADLDAAGEYPSTWQQQLESAAAMVDPSGYRTAQHFIAAFERRYGSCSLAAGLRVLHQISAHPEELATFQHEDSFATPTKATRAMIEAPPDTLDDPDLADLPAHLRRVTDSELLLFIVYLLNLPPRHPQADEARTALAPLLACRSESLRWASAITMGHLRDERAFLRLLDMLTEGMPEPEPWFATGEVERQQCWERFSFDAAHVDMIGHYELPEILWRWGDQRAIPALRAAFVRTIRIERTEVQWDPIQRWAMNWQWYHNRLLYALGRFEAFGALAGIEPPEKISASTIRELRDLSPDEAQRFRSWVDRGSVYALWGWQVALCDAALDARAASQQQIALRATKQRAGDPLPKRRVEVGRLLSKQFGLGEEERQTALRLFLDSRIDFTRS